MEQLRPLLSNLELISFSDISQFPEEKQHEVAEQIERLQDQLLVLSKDKEKHGGR